MSHEAGGTSGLFRITSTPGNVSYGSLEADFK